jgi:hypothetical protein
MSGRGAGSPEAASDRPWREIPFGVCGPRQQRSRPGTAGTRCTRSRPRSAIRGRGNSRSARRTPRVSITIRRAVMAKQALGRKELRHFSAWGEGRPETELSFRFYRQATNWIMGLSEEAADFRGRYLRGLPAKSCESHDGSPPSRSFRRSKRARYLDESVQPVAVPSMDDVGTTPAPLDLKQARTGRWPDFECQAPWSLPRCLALEPVT